jgi:hypothetical protein
LDFLSLRGLDDLELEDLGGLLLDDLKLEGLVKFGAILRALETGRESPNHLVLT